MIYAYLRVSTVAQDEENQLQGILRKAEELKITIDKYVIDRVSGTKEPNERNLGRLLKRVKEGDVLLVSELSRFGRRLFMLFRILETLQNKGVHVYSVKDGYALDNSLQSKVVAFAFGMAAEIERDMISKRTKEALHLRKLQGKKLGRPIGSKTVHHRLDQFERKMIRARKHGMSWSKIGRKFHCTDKTAKRYIERKINGE